jgi:hypothetical protein
MTELSKRGTATGRGSSSSKSRKWRRGRGVFASEMPAYLSIFENVMRQNAAGG